jgi:hypothetical protein
LGREVYRGFCLGNVKVTDHLEDISIDGRIILRWILKKWDGTHGLDSFGSG